jgi:hypothetical protein
MKVNGSGRCLGTGGVGQARNRNDADGAAASGAQEA